MNLLQMSLTAGILILGIILFRAFFINRIPKKAMILLWEIAILRLIFPIVLPLPFPGISDLGAISLDCYRVESIERAFIDIAPEIGRWKVAQGTGTWDKEEIAEMVTVSVGMEDTGAVSDSDMIVILDKSYLPWMLYGGVALVMMLISLYLYFRDSQFFREGLPMDDREKQLLLFLLEEKDMARMKKVKFCISDRTASPVTYGIFRPAIVFPKGLYQNSEKEIAFWLRHELVHIRHHDNLKKVIAHGVLCLHWFNPLVWVMVLLFNRDMELLCDETVVRKRQESRKDYALALLSMAQQKSMGFQTGLGFGKNAVTERITAVMKFKKITAGGILGAVMAVALALTVFGSPHVSYAVNSAAEYSGDSSTAEYVVVTQETAKGAAETGTRDAVSVQSMEETVTADIAYAGSASTDSTSADWVMESAYISQETEKSIESTIAEYEDYGVSITFKDGDYQLYYENEPIYFFADNEIPEEEGFSGRLFLGTASEQNGKTGVITQHDQDGKIIRMKHLSEEESKAYTERWR